ncbi:glutamine amidotransferase [Primorskyibacter sp. S187A]|uniref:glutamine amidotransferase n=1 Tax=Primorskyibacter sp. S187A TaxID=3415130 RepID=UPI003C7DA1A7
MKPFLILQLRPEADASDDEFEAICDKGGLAHSDTVRVRLDCDALPEGLALEDVSGVIVGGGPGCISDAPEAKTPVEARIEAQVLELMPEIVARDIPFMGCCYGMGVLGHYLGAKVSKDRFGEPVGATLCQMTPDGARDPLLAGLPETWQAFVGHKEAVQALPDGAVHLVASAPCPMQMIRTGQNVYATQFHPEAEAADFERRIAIYRNHGYFPPEDAERLVAACHAAQVDVPRQILKRFVARYARR